MTLVQEGHPGPDKPPYTEPQVIEALGFWGGNLCNRSEGAFVPLDQSNPEEVADASSYMDLKVAFYPAAEMGDTVDGHNTLVHLLHQLGGEMLPDGDFARLVEAHAANKELMGLIKELKPNKQNLLIGTNHPWLTNIAIESAAIYSAVDTPGFAHDSGLVLNKALGFTEVVVSKDENGQPLTKMPALRPIKQFTNVYTSVPQSDSLDRPELSILKSFSKDYNSAMLRPLIRQARSGGQVMTVACSASLDDKNEAEKTVRMKPVEEVSAEIFGRYFHFYLPVTTILDKDGRLEFNIGQIKPIAGPDDIHQLMHDLSEPYAKLLGDEWQVFYDDPRQ